jgi:rod shape-determining protein MreD
VSSTTLRYLLLIATAMVFQRFLFDQFRVAGVVADACLVLAVAAGMVAGSRRGAIVGFGAGLAYDLLVTTPFGLGALSYLVAGAAAGAVGHLVVHSARSLTILVGFSASFIGLLFFVIVGTIFGATDLVSAHLLVVLLVVPVTTSLLALPARRAVKWAESPAGSMNPAIHL